MPTIKKLKVIFELDAEVLMRALMEKNAGFSIEAYQQAVEVLPVEDAPLQIEDKSSLRTLVLERLRRTGKPTKLEDLAALADNNGYSYKQLSNMLYVLCTKKLVLRHGFAVYKISKRGMEV